MTEHSLLQEIEEDLQRQKFEALWKRFGTYIIGGALLVVLVTAAYSSWKSYRIEKRQELTAAILDITTGKETDKAKQIAALESFAKNEASTDQAVLARFHAAAIATKDGKSDQALALYEDLAADTQLEPLFHDLAIVLAVQSQLDKGDPSVLTTRLEPLLAESPWRVTAKDYSAHLALKVGDRAKAKQLFTDVTQDDRASPSQKQRANDVLRWLNEGS